MRRLRPGITSGKIVWKMVYELYSLEDVWEGLRDSYRKLAADVEARYDTKLKKVGAIGFSAMMHGYMAFDKDEKLLVPFRTWRNTITAPAHGGSHGAFSVQYSAEVEHFPLVSGNFK